MLRNNTDMRQYLLLFFLSLLTVCCAANKEEERRRVEIRSLDYSAPYHGIDVSRHNRHIDWAKVANDTNIYFVYLKATEGATHVDPAYKTYLKGARENGLAVGSYHYFRMTSTTHEQLENMKTNILKEEQDLRPMIDVETTDGHPVQEVRDSLRVFLRLVQEYYGARPVIYGTNRSYNRICGNRFNNYPLYLGRYGSNPPLIRGREHYTVWQFSENGRIDGIERPVDLCRFHPDCGFDSLLLP